MHVQMQVKSTVLISQVFRQVDRADFMTFPEKDDLLEAYEDHAWRRGTLHLSAPCIYTRAVEALCFKRGRNNQTQSVTKFMPLAFEFSCMQARLN